jgi:hypothetical protein
MNNRLGRSRIKIQGIQDFRGSNPLDEKKVIHFLHFARKLQTLFCPTFEYVSSSIGGTRKRANSIYCDYLLLFTMNNGKKHILAHSARAGGTHQLFSQTYLKITLLIYKNASMTYRRGAMSDFKSFATSAAARSPLRIAPSI